MAYRQDPDLDFLRNCSSDDLDILVNILAKDKDGDPRIAQFITIDERYKTHNPDHARYWDLIASELQCFGGNSFANLCRGGDGVLYREILVDVCDKIGVNYNTDASVEMIERNLMMKIMTDSMEKMSPEELKEVVKGMDLKTTDFSKQAALAALQIGIRSSGFIAYQVSVIVANAVARQVAGRGLSLAANATLARSIAVFAGPIGWVLSGLWALYDVAGPAYRVTMPCVIQVAFLRLKVKNSQ